MYSSTKRFTALMLTIMMVAGMMPATVSTAFAAGANTKLDEEGYVIVWEDGNDYIVNGGKYKLFTGQTMKLYFFSQGSPNIAVKGSTELSAKVTNTGSGKQYLYYMDEMALTIVAGDVPGAAEVQLYGANIAESTNEVRENYYQNRGSG